jgi:hypothetical protein
VPATAIDGLPHAFRVKTGSWTTQLPGNHLRIGINRGTSRFGIGKDFRLYRKLDPGPWFNRVGSAEYLGRYQTEVLDRLDPSQTLAAIEALARGRIRCSAASRRWSPASGVTELWWRARWPTASGSVCRRSLTNRSTDDAVRWRAPDS